MLVPLRSNCFERTNSFFIKRQMLMQINLRRKTVKKPFFFLAQEEGFEPPCLLGKRFSRPPRCDRFDIPAYHNAHWRIMIRREYLRGSWNLFHESASHTPRGCVKLACKHQVRVFSREIILRCSKSTYRLLNFHLILCISSFSKLLYMIPHFFPSVKRLSKSFLSFFEKPIDFYIIWCYNILAMWKTTRSFMPEWRNWQTPGT